jgi:hypothetical protein
MSAWQLGRESEAARRGGASEALHRDAKRWPILAEHHDPPRIHPLALKRAGFSAPC